MNGGLAWQLAGSANRRWREAGGPEPTPPRRPPAVAPGPVHTCHTPAPLFPNSSLPPSRGETKRGVGATLLRRRLSGRSERSATTSCALAASHPPPNLPPGRGEGLNGGLDWQLAGSVSRRWREAGGPEPTPPSRPLFPNSSLPPSSATLLRRWLSGRSERSATTSCTLAASHPPPSLPPGRGEGLNGGGEEGGWTQRSCAGG